MSYFQLVWVPEKLPRTVTRADWKLMDRSRRVIQRKTEELLKRDIEAIRDGERSLIFGSVNPPIMVMPENVARGDFSILPGVVTYQ